MLSDAKVVKSAPEVNNRAQLHLLVHPAWSPTRCPRPVALVCGDLVVLLLLFVGDIPLFPS